MRAQNEQLREENNRLTDLTRMLLSSQAFAGFLQELSQSGLPAPNAQTNPQQQKQVARPQPQPQSQPKPRRKDVSSNDSSHQMQVQQPQIGMALIPEVPIDLSAFQPSNAWMTALPTSSDFQVYALTTLPEVPVLDLEALSGKPESIFSRTTSTKDVPKIPELADSLNKSAETKPSMVDDTVALDREAFALYFDMPVLSDEVKQSAETRHNEVSEEQQASELQKMCNDLDEACARISKYTVHMD